MCFKEPSQPKHACRPMNAQSDHIQQIGELSQEVMHHLHNCLITKPRSEELEQIEQNDSQLCVHNWPIRTHTTQNIKTD